METWRATSGGTDAPHGKLRVDLDVRNRLAFATLVLAKIVGVAGLVIGVTSHRLVGGATKCRAAPMFAGDDEPVPPRLRD